MTLSCNVANNRLSKRREARDQLGSTRLLSSTGCPWNRRQNKKLTAGWAEQEIGFLKYRVPKNTTTATAFSVLIKSTIQRTQHITNAGVLASFLPPPSLDKSQSRNKVLGYYCTYFNLEERETTCFSPHSKKPLFRDPAQTKPSSLWWCFQFSTF